MAWTTTNGLDATRTVHQKRYAGDAEGDMVSPPAFPRWRHLEIASLDGSRSISSTVPLKGAQAEPAVIEGKMLGIQSAYSAPPPFQYDLLYIEI